MAENNEDQEALTLSEDILRYLVYITIPKTLLAPLHRVQIIQQTQDINPQFTPGTQYRGISDAFRGIYKNEGFCSFWRGNLYNSLRVFPYQIILHNLHRTLAPAIQSSGLMESQYVSLFLERAYTPFIVNVANLILYPIDIANVRVSADISCPDRMFFGTWDCLTDLLLTGGIESWYTGFGLRIPSLLILRGTYVSYSAVHNKLKSKYKFLETDFWKIISNVLFSILGAIVTYPLDTVCRRLIMDAGRESPRYKGIFDCFERIWEDEGIKGFFKGLGVCILQNVGQILYTFLMDSLIERIT